MGQPESSSEEESIALEYATTDRPFGEAPHQYPAGALPFVRNRVLLPLESRPPGNTPQGRRWQLAWAASVPLKRDGKDVIIKPRPDALAHFLDSNGRFPELGPAKPLASRRPRPHPPSATPMLGDKEGPAALDIVLSELSVFIKDVKQGRGDGFTEDEVDCMG